ncbi:TfuA-like protein [Amycolatopsis sp. A1MSW2902]|uniref:TfuA-like protein n=1 Tax=Amycolatopsis sp. A1MSW2902 TaxID=687413 RepID=UPI00307FA689
MREDAVVFLGPSLARDKAEQIVSARFLPPAAIGDVYRAALTQPSVIVIVDGYFEGVPAVWHKEILYAIDQGIDLHGCSSMGALRAAELKQAGMTGSGAVYDQYASGRLTDDDEVAVAHGDAETGYRSISDAMVNIRHGLETAQALGLVSQSAAEVLVRKAKELFYPERHWSAVLQAAEEIPEVPGIEAMALREFVMAGAPDLKAQDAIDTLTALAAGRLPKGPRFEGGFPRTQAWTEFVLHERAR